MGQLVGTLCCPDQTNSVGLSPKRKGKEQQAHLNNQSSPQKFAIELKPAILDEFSNPTVEIQNSKTLNGIRKTGALWKEEFFNRVDESPGTSIIEKMNKAHKITEDDFEFHDLIGVGGFSRVYLAHKKGIGDNSFPFAIKTISKSRFQNNSWDQFKRELQILSIVSSGSCPFVTKLYCSFQSDFNLFFCLEYVPGGSLRGYLESQGKFDLVVTKHAAAQVLLGLSFLHEKLDIIHRDLKPENVLIDANGNCKLTDFGLSKIGKNQAYSFCGTFNYLAPELLMKRSYNKMVDFWAFGCLIYEMIVGKSPFAFKNKKTAIDMITAGCFKANLIQDPMAKDLITKLLVVDPNNRLGHNGTKDLVKHPFFKDIDFKKLIQNRIDSPLKPFLILKTLNEDILNDPNFMSTDMKDVNEIQRVPQMKLEKFSWVKLRKQPSDIDIDYLES